MSGGPLRWLKISSNLMSTFKSRPRVFTLPSSLTTHAYGVVLNCHGSASGAMVNESAEADAVAGAVTAASVAGALLVSAARTEKVVSAKAAASSERILEGFIV